MCYKCSIGIYTVFLAVCELQAYFQLAVISVRPLEVSNIKNDVAILLADHDVLFVFNRHITPVLRFLRRSRVINVFSIGRNGEMSVLAAKGRLTFLTIIGTAT